MGAMPLCAEPEPTRYRYRTAALLGRWLPTHEAALLSALAAGQARPTQSGAIELFAFARIEAGHGA
jgi:hypothetical protein